MRPNGYPRRVLLAGIVAALAFAPGAIGSFLTSTPAAALEDPGTVAASVILEPAAPLAASVPLEPAAPLAAPAAQEHEREPVRHLLVEIERALPIMARPGAGRVVGTMPAGSRYYGEPTVAWVHAVSRDRRHGLVDVPYVARRIRGWIALRGLDTSYARVSVEADLSERRITVRRGDRVLFRATAATGATASPTPPGRYFVTDRVAFPAGGSLGTFAFGISGIQPRLPAWWSGGDQLAIHGTNDPSSIGRPASAGCLRVSERVLDRLKPILRLGTPVVIHP